MVFHVIFHSEEVKFLAEALEFGVAVVAYLGLAGLAALGGDEDYTVGTLGTVDGCGGSVLKDVDGFDVADIDHLEGVVHGEAVDDVERAGGLGDGSTAADGDVDVGTGSSALGDDVDAGRLACKGLGRRGDGYLGEVVARYGYGGTGEVLPLDFGVTDGYGFLEVEGAVLEGYVDDVPAGYDFGDVIISEHGEHKCACRLGHGDGITSVRSGHFADCAVLGHDDNSGDRVAVAVCYSTADGLVLGHGRKACAQTNKTCNDQRFDLTGQFHLFKG